MRTALPPASARVRCAGERHTLLWQDGTLTAFDHPDPDRERALSALGGRTYRCLQLLTAWDVHTDDLDVLALAPRGGGDRVRQTGPPDDEDDGSAAYHGSYHSYVSFSTLSGYQHHRHHHRGEPGLSDVLRLGGGVSDRLVAQVIDTWCARIADGDDAVAAARPRLHAALYGRLAAAAHDWQRDPDLAVELTMIDPTSPEDVRRSGDRLSLELPFTWLRDVWVPGLAVVADRLVLTASRDDPGRIVLGTVDRALNSVAVTIDIQLTG